ncbi:hypothetical protein AVEN_175095-1 [Araneus ventricosus]|uniref:Uncharacterized protein n=1 Tax=Araneus ventricosus TaxID=182803 RepID=A0A4Y2PPH6_ARAVE|nr:hypothetical protein AVEN_175095-1 [Araneus ventricosus]
MRDATTDGEAETPLLSEQELWRQSLEELGVRVEVTSASNSKIGAASLIWAMSSVATHQRSQGVLWKELVFEWRNYFDDWIEGLNVKDFKGLKELMIADQLKRRVPNEVKDNFLAEWGELIDPLVLAGKLDQYESVRGHRKVNPIRMAEGKPLDRARPNSPKKEHPAKKF